MSGDYYGKLVALKDSGKLSVFLIFSPPRANSSVIEHVLTLSPDVQTGCHEPFLGARKEDFNPDTGYKEIYEAVEELIRENPNEKVSIVVKEMAHWIGANEEYKKLLTLTDHPAVLLIRNPLLTVESRIRRVLKTLDMRPGLTLQRSLLDELAQDNDFRDGPDLLSSSETVVESILQKIEPELLGIKDLYNTPVLSIQVNLLDYYSKKEGYVNWRDLLDQKLYQEQDYKFFERILKVNKERVNFEENEFRKLAEIRNYLSFTGQSYIVFDTTDIRAEPEILLRELCSELGISFSQEMISWGDKSVDFHTKQNKEYEKIWYEKLFLSTELNSPSEVSPTLEMFPEFVQKYLQDVNLPIYANLSKEKVMPSEAKREIDEREFIVMVTENNRDRLDALGVLRGDDSKETSISVKLRDIDPIYALTNEPWLAKDAEFLSRKEKYVREIAIVSESLGENKELKGEAHNDFKIK